MPFTAYRSSYLRQKLFRRFTGVENIFLCKIYRNGWDSVVAGIVEMSYNWLFMGLWVTLFAGCGKAALCFSMCCELKLSMTP